MAEEKKFDPAPTDKHADDPKQAPKADKEMHDKLYTGLEGTFPASDPASTHNRQSRNRTPIHPKGSPDSRTMPGSRFSASRICRASWISLRDKPTPSTFTLWQPVSVDHPCACHPCYKPRHARAMRSAASPTNRTGI
jgi:hypothetical protein